MGELSLRERQSLLREEMILDAAHEIIAESGYSAMNMDAVAARVGISKATLYQHFPSKEEVAVRVVVRTIGRLNRFLDELDPALPAIARLEQAVRFVIAHRFASHRSDLNASRPSMHPILREHPLFQAQHDHLLATLEGLVEQAKSEGSILPDLSTRLVVQLLLSCVRDAEYEMLLSSGRYTLTELQDTLVRVLFSGLRYAAQ